MKNLINYIYKIDIIDVKKEDGYYLLKCSNTSYYFSEFSNNSFFNYIFNAVDILNNNSFFCFKFKKNIYNEIVSNIEGKKYYLMDIGNHYNDNVDFIDMIEFYNKSTSFINNSFKYQLNWDILWESKIDYLQNHFQNNILKNDNINELFYYYLGIAENALLYVREIKSSYFFGLSDKISFAHRRVDAPCKKIEFYNPCNFIIDINVRDIAEYIKSLYFSDMDYIDDLEYYLKISKLSVYSASLLYARIVYPSYFFDYYENKNNSKYVSKFYLTKDYENFIKKTHELINSYVSIKKIPWL